MAKKKKRKSNIPRHKRMKRKARLQSAKHWIPKYEGKNIIRGYSKHYNVNKLCAIKELKMLNIEIDEDYVKNLKQSLEAQKKARQERKRRKAEEKELEMRFYSDETFSYIAGYTSGGVPYGVRWDEVEEESNTKNISEDRKKEEAEVFDINDDSIPF